jgi:threonylcarbamoyladenosine tRNA methylthiotransferase MtaB
MSVSLQPEVVSLGCRLNIAESEAIRAMLRGRDVVVVNSCAVTEEAVKQTRAALRRARRARPGAELVVTGCAAEIDPAGIGALADRVVPNALKRAPASWGRSGPPLPAAFAGHARAFVEVQNGCDHACTFCAIPAGRGPSRSRVVDAIVTEVEALVAAGHREVVLTGVDLTSYAANGLTLGDVVARVLDTGVGRLRLSSLDAMEVDDRLFELVTGEPRVMPHLHLSLQAGSDLILKRMRRRHLRADAIRLVERLKRARPGIAIGADLIAGFPTEDEAMFADTLALLDECDVVHAHIFPYSAKAGTPAARMPQVPMPVRRERAARLRAAAAARKLGWLRSLVGGEQAVLVERPGTQGRGEGFAAVRLAAPALVGSVVRVRVTATDGDVLHGEMI